MFVSDVIKTRVWWPIAANQKKKKKKYKNKKYFIQKKNAQNYLGPRKIKKWKNKKEYYSEKTHKIIMTHECQIWYVFWIASKNFWLLLAIAELAEKEEEIRKNIRTWGCGTSHFPAMALSRGGRRGSQISIFFRTNILSKPFIPYCSHDWPKTFPHCYAASFSYISST